MHKSGSDLFFLEAIDVTKFPSQIEFQRTRLDSWKSIAQHLGRSCRTVQRWHSEYGLPVHRLGGEAGSVFAFTDELDRWLRNRDAGIGTEATRGSRPVLIRMPRSEPDPGADSEPYPSVVSLSSDKTRSAELVAQAFGLWGFLSRHTLRMIARLFREALDLDPDNAAACSGLALSLIAQGLIGNLNPREAYSSAHSVLERAQQVSPLLGEAKCALAWLRMVRERDWQDARRLFDEALEHSPESPRAQEGRALLHIAEGSLDRAAELLLAASRSNAFNILSTGLYCWCEYLRGDYANAAYRITQARESGQSGTILVVAEALTSVQAESAGSSAKHIEMLIEDDPDNCVLLGALGYVCGANGLDRKSRAILDRIILHASQGHDQAHYGLALAYLGLNETEKAWQELDRSYRTGSVWSLGFPSDPVISRLRDDSRYSIFMGPARYPIAGDVSWRDSEDDLTSSSA